jgi:hypothetical protein
MKCDRRWWNDGRLEFEQAACVGEPDPEPLGLPHEPDEAYAVRFVCRSDKWTRLRTPSQAEMDAHISASMDALWRKLMEGDPNGQPWHEVLAAWAPAVAGSRSFFAEPALRNQIICGSEQLLMRALERAGVKMSAEPAPALGGIRIREDAWCPRDRAVFIDHEGKVTWFTLAGGGGK